MLQETLNNIDLTTGLRCNQVIESSINSTSVADHSNSCSIEYKTKTRSSFKSLIILQVIAMYGLGVCLLSLCLCVVDVFAVPQCNPAVTSKMSELYPDGIPTNMIETIKNNGPYSYVIVSSVEKSQFGVSPKCLGITMKDDSTAQVKYKFPLVPTLTFNFPVKEDNGVLIQTDGREYKLYVLYIQDGVIFTYRCCDTCVDSAPNVGIAVSDRQKSSSATKNALAAAKKKMAELGLDSDVATLNSCS